MWTQVSNTPNNWVLSGQAKVHTAFNIPIQEMQLKLCQGLTVPWNKTNLSSDIMFWYVERKGSEENETKQNFYQSVDAYRHLGVWCKIFNKIFIYLYKRDLEL